MEHISNERASQTEMPLRARPHVQFKVFTVGDGIAHEIAVHRLDEIVQAFTNSRRIHVKSIAMAYLPTTKQLALTLGYSSDVHGRKAKLASEKLGHLWRPNALGDALTKASEKISDVIAHATLVDAHGEVTAVFLSYA
jgi:hypothetical protein